LKTGNFLLDGQQAGDPFDVVSRKRRERIVHRDGELFRGLRDRDQTVLASEGLRDRARHDVEIEAG
jgi:hypothetical protein